VEDLDEIKEKINQKKNEVVQKNIFENTEKNEVVEVKQDKKSELVEDMFEQAVVHQVSTNKELQTKVLDTAKTFTETKMQTIATNVNTEYKEANFNNKKDACESYGFNEKTTPVWATNIMTWGYNVMLAIWLFIGSFTFMPVIFIAKKISVGLKKTWIAIVCAIILYAGITFVPILLALL